MIPELPALRAFCFILGERWYEVGFVFSCSMDVAHQALSLSYDVVHCMQQSILCFTASYANLSVCTSNNRLHSCALTLICTWPSSMGTGSKTPFMWSQKKHSGAQQRLGHCPLGRPVNSLKGNLKSRTFFMRLFLLTSMMCIYIRTRQAMKMNWMTSSK